ncbi:hypothetical protein V6N13_046253 [Hibiscus sabdariffa]|uniref:Uncharacterized protein n=2 Tax=Hibiscus sabdariffa TaxID=183260 RepID=A0ABR2D9K6_9ROSI
MTVVEPEEKFGPWMQVTNRRGHWNGNAEKLPTTKGQRGEKAQETTQGSQGLAARAKTISMEGVKEGTKGVHVVGSLDIRMERNITLIIQQVDKQTTPIVVSTNTIIPMPSMLNPGNNSAVRIVSWNICLPEGKERQGGLGERASTTCTPSERRLSKIKGVAHRSPYPPRK